MGATAVFVVHDEPAQVRAGMLEDLEVPFPVLVDQQRHAYAAWGMERVSWWKIWLDPQVWKAYAGLLAGGARLRAGGQDVLQMGGDFIVAKDGTITYSRPQERDDRPPVGRLLALVDEAARQ